MKGLFPTMSQKALVDREKTVRFLVCKGGVACWKQCGIHSMDFTGGVFFFCMCVGMVGGTQACHTLVVEISMKVSLKRSDISGLPTTNSRVKLLRVLLFFIFKALSISFFIFCYSINM